MRKYNYAKIHKWYEKETNKIQKKKWDDKKKTEHIQSLYEIYLTKKTKHLKNVMHNELLYKFEDNDKRGIKMVHRFQFILCKYDSIEHILKSFDMYPSMVAFDSDQVYFTEKSLQAYQHMINVVEISKGNELYKHRLNKYFRYGFQIVLPRTDRDWKSKNFGYKNKYIKCDAKDRNNENKIPLSFDVNKANNNVIYVKHGSSYKFRTDIIEMLEEKQLRKNRALYVSYDFCSFVSFLRYVSINNIGYVFPQATEGDDIKLPFEGETFKSSNNDVIKFIERLDNFYDDGSWFKQFYESIILNTKECNNNLVCYYDSDSDSDDEIDVVESDEKESDVEEFDAEDSDEDSYEKININQISP